MRRRKLLTLIALGILPGYLAGCTSFAPVYGGGTAVEDASAIRFNFARPDTRLEQIILDRLKVAFPGPARPEDPVLDIAATSRTLPSPVSDAFQVGRPANVRVEATVTISLDDNILFSATRFADTSHQGRQLTPVDLASGAGALETGARSTAEGLRSAILATYGR